MAVKVESAPVEPQDTPMRNLDDSNGPAEVFEDPSSQAQARKGVAVLDDVVAPKTGRAGEFSHEKGDRPALSRNSSSRRSFTQLNPLPVRPTWAKYVPFRWSRESKGLPWNGRKLIRAAEFWAGLAILFYGYDQGVMSGVNTSPHYRQIMGITDDTPRNSAAEGGIVSVYYGGTLIGGLIAGSVADRLGRLPVIGCACICAILGAALQASSQEIAMMCIARVITGLGTGALNCAVPVWSAELNSHTRGAALGFEFFLNICGLALAYWIEYGLRGTNEQLRWRLPLALQIVFLVGLLCTIHLFPESPRWLVRMGDEDDARHILARLHTEDANEEDEAVNNELYAIGEVVSIERREKNANHYWPMVAHRDRYRTRRRIGLVVLLQIMQELVGIGVVTVYAPTVFAQAGFSENKSALLSGINDLSYAASVWVAVLTLDRVGRRPTLFTGAIVMGISLIFCGIAARYAADTTLSASSRLSWGSVVTAGTFVYTATFGATWLTIPWLFPVETVSLHVRAKGAAYSVLGWSIGNGVVTMITPFLFKAITYWTFILFALLNFATLPVIWALYPETSGRSLEEMDVLFTSSVWVWKAEKEIKELAEADPELFEAARRGDTDAMAVRKRVKRQNSQATVVSSVGSHHRHRGEKNV